MPAFFFHLENGDHTRDEVGTDLATLHDARCHAVRMMAEVLCNAPERYWEHEEYKVTVEDISGLLLFTVEISSTDSPAVR